MSLNVEKHTLKNKWTKKNVHQTQKIILEKFQNNCSINKTFSEAK